MIRNFNTAQLLGNVGREPELRTTTNGTSVTDFSLATTKKWITKEGEERSDTQWHKIVAWGKLAESVCKIIGKGDLVLVDGEISYRQYEKDGETKSITEIESNRILRMESKGSKIYKKTIEF